MNEKILKEGAAELSLFLDGDKIDRFKAYSALLKEWNEKMNLTAVTDDDGISVKHFLDSILPLAHIDLKDGASVADIGTGAGFPGIPFKIVRSDISLTLIDSLNKRITFLNEVIKSLDLEDVQTFHGRAEDMGKTKDFRERFDMVVSRAVANLRVLSEYCLPFVKVGGSFVALKSENTQEEIKEAEEIIKALGGKIESVIEARLPKSDIVRNLIVIKKEKSTPIKYPRRADKIKKG